MHKPLILSANCLVLQVQKFSLLLTANIFKNSLPLIFLCVFSFDSVHGQDNLGKPFITNYSYKDYNAGPINWWAIEDNRGIMYFANGRGVLEFDGENWTIIPSKNKSGARSFAKDDQGIIYVGFEDDIGYLAPDHRGKMTFHSLRDKVPEEHNFIQTVWETDFFNGFIYYRTSNKLYKWDGNEISVIVSDDALHVGSIVNDKYYIRIWNKGLSILENDKFKLVPNGEKFISERIYVMLPYDENNIFIGTRNQGFYLYDGNDFTPFKTEIDELVRGDLYLTGVALEDGRYILNSFSNGAYIINKEGKLLQSLTQATGLQDNSVDNVFVDSRGVLWLTLFNGISSVNLNSQFSYFDQTMGLPSNVVFTFYKKDGILYAGTNDGVYIKTPDNREFEPMVGTHGQIANFIEHNGRLFNASGGMGLYEITGTTFKYVRKDNNYDMRINQLVKSRIDENRLYATHNDGMASFYFDNKINNYVEESYTLKFHPNIGGFEEDVHGNLWGYGTSNGSIDVLKPKYINGKLNLEQSDITTYDADNGLPNNLVSFWMLNDTLQVYDLPNRKTYRFDEDKEQFVETEFEFSDRINYDGPLFAYPTQDKEGKTWFSTGDGILIESKTSEGVTQYQDDPFLELRSIPIWNIFIDEKNEQGNQIAWFQGPDGIIRYEGNLSDPFLPAVDVKLRSILIGADSAVYSGGVSLPDKLTFGNDHNTVSFSYAAPFFIGNEELEYKTQLEGYETSWSKWSKDYHKSYINLPAGDYNFKVVAKNLYGEESEETTFSFSISSPWYATWWAYILYALALIGLIYLIVKSRTKFLRIRQKELELAVDERTAEVQQRVDELATVNRVSQMLTEKLELSELIQLVGEQMQKLFKANISYLAIHDANSDIISFPYQYGDAMEPMKLGQGLTSQIIKTGEPLLINRDISYEYKNLGIEQIGKNASSYLGVPIPVENHIIGVLSVQSTEHENRFNENDKRLLNTIARNVGIALHNAELYEEAKLAKAQAEDANEAKSAFLSTVSHELRTPLTSVLGFAKIIRKRLEDKIFPNVQIDDQRIKKTMKQVSENLGVVISEGERLTNLINDVLDLAKIESGKMEWEMKPIFLQDIIQRAISSTTSLFDEKGLKLEKLVPSNLPVISGDQDKLIQVMINLLSNAVKFTDKGKVVVEAYQDKGQLIVEIQDTGIGISEEDKHKVFERFRQAGDTLTDKPKGTGLGLPICREIIERHGGIIWMNSEYGVGSTFFFSMPILGDASSVNPIQLDNIVNSLKKQINNSVLKSDDKTSTILVVDDDTPIRSLLKQELNDAGYKVTEAANGKAALDMVRVKKPDLIILDVMMPEINGFDVAAVLKNDPDTMDIPIIILSIVEDKERGLQIGVDRYLTKPIDTEKLFHEVDSLLEQGVSRKKVLVIDEDKSTVKTLSDVLQARGYKVSDINGRNIVQQALENKPDIIMLNSIYNEDKELIKNLKFKEGMENVLFFVYQ